MPNYDDPVEEEKWCLECRAEAGRYLKAEGVVHGRIGEWPAWHVAPFVSIWAIESGARIESVGWWVVCGDLPTDYVSASTIKHPRDAMHALSKRWSEVADHMSRGAKHPTVSIGTLKDSASLGPLLRLRAEALAKWANDDNLWADEFYKR